MREPLTGGAERGLFRSGGEVSKALRAESSSARSQLYSVIPYYGSLQTVSNQLWRKLSGFARCQRKRKNTVFIHKCDTSQKKFLSHFFFLYFFQSILFLLSYSTSFLHFSSSTFSMPLRSAFHSLYNSYLLSLYALFSHSLTFSLTAFYSSFTPHFLSLLSHGTFSLSPLYILHLLSLSVFTTTFSFFASSVSLSIFSICFLFLSPLYFSTLSPFYSLLSLSTFS